jgi:copper(I)-binding protein
MMATAGAAYMTITSSTADKLVGASVDASVAAVVEIHETRMVDGGMGTDTTMMMGGDTTMPGMGAMEMVPVDSLDIPAGTAVELAPGGYHLMLLDLAAPLELGSTFTVTLVFEQAGERLVEVVVADSAP